MSPKNPKHKSPKQHNRTAHAPYNFVPLPEQVVTVDDPPPQDIYDGLTGYIECTLTTRSPLYTRCAMNPEVFKAWGETPFHELPEAQKNERALFFSLDDVQRPVIPGSSLRGMVRALVEIVGYGKVQDVSDDLKITFRAVAAPRSDPLAEPYKQVLRNVRAGYLAKKGQDWYVHPARWPSEQDPFLKVKETVLLKSVRSLIPFDDPDYRPQYHPFSFKSEGHRHQAVIVCSGNMLETGKPGQQSPRSSHVIVLDKNPSATPLKISPQAIVDYLDSLTPFQKEPPFDEQMGCLIEGRPVFYVETGEEICFFGHSPNFRIPATLAGASRAATPQDFVPERLHNTNQLDLAEAIFGFVPKDKSDERQALAGRVFFTDAEYQSASDGVWEPIISPQILASPKPTSFQHYLVQDSQAGHNPDDKRSLAHYATPTPDKTVIRGHKLYWHRGEVGVNDIRADPEDVEKHPSQYTRMKPVKAGVMFKFKIYFENLREFELGVLLWALTLPGEEGKEYCHTLGMGNPLGMGAVVLKPELCLGERDAEQGRYTRLFDEQVWHRAEQLEPDCSQFIKAFEGWILAVMYPGKQTRPQSLSQLDRIQSLLKMLEWPGPSRNATTYMQIEPNNEYKDRPVLPNAQDVK